MDDNIFKQVWSGFREKINQRVDSGDLFFKKKELINKKKVLKDLEEGEIQKGTREDICLFLEYNFDGYFGNKTIENLKEILEKKIHELKGNIRMLEKEIEELNVNIKKYN